MSPIRREVFASRTAKMVLRERWIAQAAHCHRPVELVLALDGPVAMLCEQGGTASSDCYVVPPMSRHALLDYDGRIARIYLDIGYCRLTAWKGQSLQANLGKQDDLRARVRRFFDSDRGPEEAGGIIDRWLGSWLDENEVGPSCDSRVADVLAYLDSQDAPLRADRRGLAKLVSLSPTRLAAIFAENTGMSLSRYLIWRRVKIALARICEGESITHAAAEAGFADNAHFTRSCRATYGCTPSSVVGFSVVPVTHVAFGKQPAAGRHICLAPHEATPSP